MKVKVVNICSSGASLLCEKFPFEMFCRLRKQWRVPNLLSREGAWFSWYPIRFGPCRRRVLRQCCRLPLNVFCILISLFGGCLCASSVETGDRKHTANLLHQLSVQQQQQEQLQQWAALEAVTLRRHRVHTNIITLQRRLASPLLNGGD